MSIEREMMREGEDITPSTLQIEVAWLTAAGHKSHAGHRKEMFERWRVKFEKELREKIEAEHE